MKIVQLGSKDIDRFLDTDKTLITIDALNEAYGLNSDAGLTGAEVSKLYDFVQSPIFVRPANAICYWFGYRNCLVAEEKHKVDDLQEVRPMFIKLYDLVSKKLKQDRKA